MRLKILYVITSLRPGGAERLVVDLAIGLKRRGHIVDILVFDNSPSFLYDELRNEGVKVINSGAGYLQMWNPLHIFKIKKVVKNNKYDIVHSHNTSAQLFTALAKPGKTIKSVTTEHNTTNRRRKLKLYRPLDSLIYNKYDKIVCVSNTVREQLVHYLRDIDSDRYITIYNGVDLKKYNRSDCESNMSRNKIILMVAGFRKQKDHFTAIKAINKLPESYILWLVGDGATKKKCEQLVTRLKLNERVIFLGVSQNIPDLIQKSDIILLSSHYEGLSLFIVEGMASGKPCIGSNVPGISEVLDKYGILYKHSDPDDLAFKIESLIENPQLYNSVVRSCYERAQDFDIEKTISCIESLYLSL